MNIYEIFMPCFPKLFVSFIISSYMSCGCIIIKCGDLCVTIVRRLFHHVWNIQIRDSCLSFYKRLTFVINMTDVYVMVLL